MNNMFKGTKGPWKPYYTQVIGDITGEVHEITVMPDRRQASQHVAITWDKKQIGRNGGLTYEEAQANSHLICAAPELLSALQELTELMEAAIRGEYSPDSFTTQPARKAINKALNL